MTRRLTAQEPINRSTGPATGQGTGQFATLRLQYSQALYDAVNPEGLFQHLMRDFCAETAAVHDLLRLHRENIEEIARIDPHKMGGIAAHMARISEQALRERRNGSVAQQLVDSLADQDPVRTLQSYRDLMGFQQALLAVARHYDPDTPANRQMLEESLGQVMSDLRDKLAQGYDPGQIATAIRAIVANDNQEETGEAAELRREISALTMSYLENAANEAREGHGDIGLKDFGYSTNRVNFYLKEAADLIAIARPGRVEQAMAPTG